MASNGSEAILNENLVHSSDPAGNPFQDAEERLSQVKRDRTCNIGGTNIDRQRRHIIFHPPTSASSITEDVVVIFASCL